MSGISVGYARVSTTDQDLTIQLEVLENSGCTRVFSEQVSGKSADGRSELQNCLKFVREGDTLVVTRLDRLGRSVRDLLTIIEDLARRGVKFRCVLQPQFDFSEASGKLFFTMLAGFAEFELNIRKERQAEGIARAKAEHRFKGGKPKFDRRKTEKAARDLHLTYRWGASRIAKHLKMSIRTLYRLTDGATPPIWGAEHPNLARAIPSYDVSAEPESDVPAI